MMSVQVRQLAKKLEALFDLVAREMLQALGAKALDGERAHDAAVEHCLFKDLRRQLFLRGDVSEEAAGEAVARPCRINHFGKRQRRRTEGMMRFDARKGGSAKESGR